MAEVALAVEIHGSLELASSRACRIKELNGGLRSGLLHPLFFLEDNVTGNTS